MLVQFGNNWIQKIPRTAKLDSALAVLGIFLIQLFPNWTACSPITYTNPRKTLISSSAPVERWLFRVESGRQY